MQWPFAIGQFATLLGLFLAAAHAHAQTPKDPEFTSARIGFDGAYKVGSWTQLELTLRGGADPFTGRVTVTVPDSDGVPTTVFTPAERPVGVIPGETTTVRLFVRPGQDGADLVARFIDDRGKERALRRFRPTYEPADGSIPIGSPASARIVVMFGGREGLGDLFRNDSADQLLATRGVRVQRAADLPVQWYGYEAIDTVLLFGSQPELYRTLTPDSPRLAALTRWVELGGRLVIFCGDGAPELLAPEGPLAPLIPGKFDSLIPLRQSSPLEAFSGDNTPITRGQFELRVPKLTDIQGRILAHDGQDPALRPLVIRARRGLGEVTFVAVDPDEPPLDKWPGRTSFLRQALGWPAAPREKTEDSGAYRGPGNEDSVNQLRRALDGQFVGVKTAPFSLVALLVITYIGLIGPGDYFFVKRILKRMEATWVTFPLIVVAVSTAAYFLAYWMKGDQLRVNQVEIVDVDVEKGEVRGTVWTHFFSPRVERYNLSLAPRIGKQDLPATSETERPTPDEPSSSAATLVAWLGAPGFGLGGMEGQHGEAGLFERGYRFSDHLDALIEMPVEEWSTKTLVGRWSANVPDTLEANLTLRGGEQVSGRITNRLGVTLQDCVLLHANLAYSLPSLADGATATIEEQREPKTIKATLGAGEPYGAGATADPATPYNVYSEDVPRIVKTMMFYEAIGGENYATIPNRYQSFVDLSRLLTGDQAILLARASTDAGSQWQNTDGETTKPLASKQDLHWIYYRFVIPLRKPVEVVVPSN